MRAFALRLGTALLPLLPVAMAAVVLPGPLVAQEAAEQELTTLVADMVRIDGENVLVAEGNVEVYARGARLRASRAVVFGQRSAPENQRPPLIALQETPLP